MGMVNETLKAPACSPAIEAFSIAARRSAAVVHQRHDVNAPVPVVGVRDVVGTERDRAKSQRRRTRLDSSAGRRSASDN
jgi:hypothetical protein